VSDISSLQHYDLIIINEYYHFMTSFDQFPVPIRSAVKSDWTVL